MPGISSGGTIFAKYKIYSNTKVFERQQTMKEMVIYVSFYDEGSVPAFLKKVYTSTLETDQIESRGKPW